MRDLTSPNVSKIQHSAQKRFRWRVTLLYVLWLSHQSLYSFLSAWIARRAHWRRARVGQKPRFLVGIPAVVEGVKTTKAERLSSRCSTFVWLFWPRPRTFEPLVHRLQLTTSTLQKIRLPWERQPDEIYLSSLIDTFAMARSPALLLAFQFLPPFLTRSLL